MNGPLSAQTSTSEMTSMEDILELIDQPGNGFTARLRTASILPLLQIRASKGLKIYEHRQLLRCLEIQGSKHALRYAIINENIIDLT